MKHTFIIPVVALITSAASAQTFNTLWGTKSKVDAAHAAAVEQDLTFMTDSAHAQRFLKLGLLVRLGDTPDYRLHQVSQPFVRPAAKLFVDRFSTQYRAANAERLVVTSAMRTLAKNRGVWNASQKSVHPTGIAVDFRVPSGETAKVWLEQALLQMQSRGVVIATREHNPPHYHVVVLPQQYLAYVATKTNPTAARR